MLRELPTSGQPRRNEDRFYRYPDAPRRCHRRRRLAVDAALHELERADMDVSSVHVLRGTEGARLLDSSAPVVGCVPGCCGRPSGALRDGHLQAHPRAPNKGHRVVYVPARTDDDRRRVVHILRGAGGHCLLYFRAWSIEEIRVQPDPSSVPGQRLSMPARVVNNESPWSNGQKRPRKVVSELAGSRSLWTLPSDPAAGARSICFPGAQR
jgi:hypothetical protein